MTVFVDPTFDEAAYADDQPFIMLDLERELAGPGGANLCEQYIVQFRTVIAHIESIQQIGLTPARFSQSEIIWSAFQSAVRCLSGSSYLLS